MQLHTTKACTVKSSYSIGRVSCAVLLIINFEKMANPNLVSKAKNAAGTLGKDALVAFFRETGINEEGMENWSKGQLANVFDKCNDDDLQKFISQHSSKQPQNVQ